jgi:hypothetical protein
LQVLRAGCVAERLEDVLAALVVQFCFIFFSRSDTAMAMRNSEVTLSPDHAQLCVTAFQHKGRTHAASAQVPPQVFPLTGVPELAALLLRFRRMRLRACRHASTAPDEFLLSVDGRRPTTRDIQAAFVRGLALPGVDAPPANVSWTSHSGRHGGATAAYQARLPMQWIAHWGAWAPTSQCLSTYVHVTAPFDEVSRLYFGYFLP